MKQDTKNLNHNARKLKVHCGVGDYLPNQPIAEILGLKVVLPAMGVITLGELLKHTRTSNLMDGHKCRNCGENDVRGWRWVSGGHGGRSSAFLRRSEAFSSHDWSQRLKLRILMAAISFSVTSRL